MLLWMGIALGQSNPDVPAINSQRFRPSIDSRYTIWTDDAGRSEGFRPSFRALVHYDREPLVYTFESGGNAAMVQHLVQTDLVAGIGYERFRIGAHVPIYALATSQIVGTQAGIGDLALDGKITLLDGEKAPARIAVTGRLGFPTATLSNALGARKFTWELNGVVDRSFGDAQVGVNVGLRGGPNVQLENVRVDDFALFRVGGGYQFTKWLAAGAEVVADVPLHSDAADALAVEWMANGRIQVARAVQLRGAFGTGLTSGVATPDWRALVGVVFQAEGPRDADQDGVVDAVDACKDEPEDLDGERDEDGCPDDEGSLVVQVVDEDGVALLDAEITVGDASGRGALQTTLPSGQHVIKATAAGREPGELKVEIVDTDVNKKRTLELRHGPVPVTVEVRGPSGVLDGEVLLGDDPVSDTLDPGVVRLTAHARGHSSQERMVEVVGGVPVTVVFDLKPERVPLLVAEDGAEGHVQFNGAEIADEDGVIEAIVQMLSELPDTVTLVLRGQRTEAEEADLAEQRAELTRIALVERGVATERLELKSDPDPSPHSRVEVLLAR